MEAMMYKRHLNQINLLDEPEYFGGIALDKDNEWVKLAKMIPWHEFEDEYADLFTKQHRAACMQCATGAGIITDCILR